MLLKIESLRLRGHSTFININIITHMKYNNYNVHHGTSKGVQNYSMVYVNFIENTAALNMSSCLICSIMKDEYVTLLVMVIVVYMLYSRWDSYLCVCFVVGDHHRELTRNGRHKSKCNWHAGSSDGNKPQTSREAQNESSMVSDFCMRFWVPMFVWWSL